MLLIFFLLIIFSAGLLITWMHYQQQKSYQEKIEQVMNGQLDQATLQSAAINKLNIGVRGVAEGITGIENAINFRPKNANEAMVRHFVESGKPGVSSFRLSIPNNNRIPLYAFIQQLQEAGMNVFSEQRNDATSDEYGPNMYWLYIGNGKQEEELEEVDSIVLRLDTIFFPLNKVMDSENLKIFSIDDELPCITSVSAFTVGDCDRECQSLLISKVSRILKDCAGITFVPNSTEGVIWVHRVNGDGRIISQRTSYNELDKAFFDAAYTELRTEGPEVRSVRASKLVDGLIKTWNKRRCNICIFGAPGTGKSTLLKAIAKVVSDNNMKVITISGKDFAKHFSNPDFMSNLKAYWEGQKVTVLIDEFHNLSTEETATIKSVLDGLDSMEDVSFVISTNEEEFNDPAITRSGRMEMVLSIRAFASKEDAENLYNMLVKQNPQDHWKPFPQEYAVPMTLADICGLRSPASLLDAIKQ